MFCYLVCKIYEDKKIEIMSIYIAQFIDTIASYLVLTHLFNFFIVTKRISDWHHFCKWMCMLFSQFCRWHFCWNYATYTFCRDYAGDTNVLLQLCRFWGYVAIMQVVLSVTVIIGGSFCCNHAGDCFFCNYAVRSFYST